MKKGSRSPWRREAELRSKQPKSRRRGLPYDDFLDVETTVLADFLVNPHLLPRKPPSRLPRAVTR